MFCRSFKPLVKQNSRVLILGSMPGPEALRKQEFYGFTGNHFWTIIPRLLKESYTTSYPKKLAMLRRHRVALWDVLESCHRPGALDSSIRSMKLNPIPDLLRKHRRIQAVFINGQFAYKTFMKHYADVVDRPVFALPSTSPANAAMPIKEKLRRWGAIRKFL